MRIKICGLKREEDIAYVNRCNPDYIGFVFAGSKRKIDFDTARSLKSKLTQEISSVGVFVNEQIDFIIHLVAEQVIDVVQLHGDEDADYIERLHTALHESCLNRNVTIIKAIRVQTTEQVIKAQELDVDYLLLDAYKRDEYGGSGKAFDHTLIPKLTKPYFLAGGISIEDVTSILNALKEKENIPYCVDVSSFVESNGVKDERKIYEMVNLVHAYK